MSKINYHSEFGPMQIDFDPSKYKTAAGAAKAFHKVLTDLAKSIGCSPEYVYLWNPKETAERREHSNSWCVCWDEGCFEWAVGTSDEINHERGFCDWYAQPYYSFDMCFVKV